MKKFMTKKKTNRFASWVLLVCALWVVELGILRVCGLTSLSWWWITAPLWLYASVLIVGILITIGYYYKMKRSHGRH